MIQKSKRKYDCVSILQRVNKKIDKLINTNSKKLIIKQSSHTRMWKIIFSFLINEINALGTLYCCGAYIHVWLFFSMHTASVKHFYYFVLLISLTRVTWDSSKAQVGILHNITSIQLKVYSALESLVIQESVTKPATLHNACNNTIISNGLQYIV